MRPHWLPARFVFAAASVGDHADTNIPWRFWLFLQRDNSQLVIIVQ
jgi:hypothetical protein